VELFVLCPIGHKSGRSTNRLLFALCTIGRKSVRSSNRLLFALCPIGRKSVRSSNRCKSLFFAHRRALCYPAPPIPDPP